MEAASYILHGLHPIEETNTPDGKILDFKAGLKKREALNVSLRHQIFSLIQTASAKHLVPEMMELLKNHIAEEQETGKLNEHGLIQKLEVLTT